jgi:integrase
MKWLKTKYPGVYVRHQKGCPAGDGSTARCRCQKSWRVKYREEGGAPKWSRTLKTEAEARSWHSDKGKSQTTPAASRVTGTFNALAAEWVALAESGAVAQRSGKAYTAGTLRVYKRGLANHVEDGIGKREAAKLTVVDWQLWLDARAHARAKRNTIESQLNAIRAIYRWACSPTRRILTVNATSGLEMPARDETPRDRVAPPEEAKKLLAALEPIDRTSYGLAMLAGLRNAERAPLDWTDIDFDKGRLGVRDSKSEAGIRWLPIVAPLRAILREEWMRQGKPSAGLVCRGPKGGVPTYNAIKRRASEAWEAEGLEPIGFHECRHTFITTMIHAGLNAKAVSVLAGHASIDVTFNVYGHMFSGSEDEAGRLLDAYLSGSSQKADLDSLSRHELIALVRSLSGGESANVSTLVSNESPQSSESTV